MRRPGEEKRPAGLTGEGLEALLSHLDADRNRAGERYEEIRRRLVRLFEWRSCACPEELADETINRVARRMAEGLELRLPDPYGFFCGVANMVYKEELRRNHRERVALETGDWLPGRHEEPAEDEHLEELRHCLDQLALDQRRLILLYHRGEDSIRSRKVLSEELGIPMNALRIRVHRLRRKLEECVVERLRR